MAENAVGVLDGATPIDRASFKGYASPAAWMAGEIAARFAALSRPVGDYRSVCGRIVEELGCEGVLRGLPDCQKPCCTNAMIVVDDAARTLKVYVIGDSLAALLMTDGSMRVVEDLRMRPFVGATMRAHRKGDDRSVRLQRIENRAMMNREDGYWTIAFQGDFVNRFVEQQFEKGDVASALACTDGYARLFEGGFALVSMRSVLDGSVPLSEGLTLLREREATRADQGFIKRSDDAAAVLLRF